MIAEAVVLAGGFGTRLRATVPGLPKPMAPVAGRPFLELLLWSLAGHGVRRVVLSLGHMADAVTDHFGAAFCGMALQAEIETRPLGTGGALRAALRRCSGDVALVVNGDTFLEFDAAVLHDAWLAHRRPLLLGVQVADTQRYGRLRLDGTRLVGFADKGTAGVGCINSGHYVVPTGLLEPVQGDGAFSFETDFLAPNVDTLGFEVVLTSGRFIDIGIPSDYARAQTELADVAAAVAGRDTQ